MVRPEREGIMQYHVVVDDLPAVVGEVTVDGELGADDLLWAVAYMDSVHAETDCHVEVGTGSVRFDVFTHDGGQYIVCIQNAPDMLDAYHAGAVFLQRAATA